MKKFGKTLLFLAAFLMCLPAAGSAMTAEEFASMYDQLEKIDFGGALRFQYQYKDYNETNKDKSGEFGFDTFRLNVDGEIGEMILSAEYRFYPKDDWNNIHHGWIGYNFNENWQGQVGVHQVPFGIQPYASHNFWFSGAYYFGFEDDYDMGVKALYNNGPWDLALAFYKNGELSDASESGRYSIDVLSGAADSDFTYGSVQTGLSNEETNQGNIRLAYTATHDDNNSTEFGVSGQYGRLYNNQTNKNGEHWAGAAHMVGNYGRWNIQLEGIYYKFDPENPETFDSDTGNVNVTENEDGTITVEPVTTKIAVNDDLINVGGYNFVWAIPAEATIGIFNVAYTLPVDIGPISSLTFYSDNTAIEPASDITGINGSDLEDTIWQNVVGCLIASGPVYTYIDIISTEDMIFGGGGTEMVDGTDESDRDTRININFGYYF